MKPRMKTIEEEKKIEYPPFNHESRNTNDAIGINIKELNLMVNLVLKKVSNETTFSKVVEVLQGHFTKRDLAYLVAYAIASEQEAKEEPKVVQMDVFKTPKGEA